MLPNQARYQTSLNPDDFQLWSNMRPVGDVQRNLRAGRGRQRCEGGRTDNHPAQAYYIRFQRRMQREFFGELPPWICRTVRRGLVRFRRRDAAKCRVRGVGDAAPYAGITASCRSGAHCVPRPPLADGVPQERQSCSDIARSFADANGASFGCVAANGRRYGQIDGTCAASGSFRSSSGSICA